MDPRASLTHLDGELRRLRVEADFAEARYGAAHGAGLRHCHDELVPVITTAFAQISRATDLTLSRRDRAGLHAHAGAICAAMQQDLTDIESRFSRVIERGASTGPGARGLVEQALARGLVAVDVWWEGRLRLGPLTSPAVAARDWKQFRPPPRWLGWTVGGAATATVLLPGAMLFF